MRILALEVEVTFKYKALQNKKLQRGHALGKQRCLQSVSQLS